MSMGPKTDAKSSKTPVSKEADAEELATLRDKQLKNDKVSAQIDKQIQEMK